jgi:hypothetical protein
LITPQPPPINNAAELGSTLRSLPLSNSRRMRETPSGEESSMTTFSFAYLSLTSDRPSTAQLTLVLRPEETVIR